MNARVVYAEEIENAGAQPSSQLFGEVDLPDEWLENDVFSPCEFFLCKIDLSVFGGGGLPSEGLLYVFVDMPSTLKKAKAKIRFFDGEPDARTDFNDGFFDEYVDAEFLLPASKPFADVKATRGGERDELDENNVAVNELNGDVITIVSVPTELLPSDLSSFARRLSVVLDADAARKNDFSCAKLTFS